MTHTGRNPIGEPTGKIDMENDPACVRFYKAGRGALAYGLRQAGWTEERITNGLRTHFEAAVNVVHHTDARRGTDESK